MMNFFFYASIGITFCGLVITCLSARWNWNKISGVSERIESSNLLLFDETKAYWYMISEFKAIATGLIMTVAGIFSLGCIYVIILLEKNYPTAFQYFGILVKMDWFFWTMIGLTFFFIIAMGVMHPQEFDEDFEIHVEKKKAEVIPMRRD